ncbi:MAG: tRNA threonylcarbamoyladenosine dehydratase [Clostridia bacterium]|nr:tRNA threonylcarbamoyladenosine dehydratase [Clostridia bacterium]
MEEIFSRTRRLIGDNALEKLKNSRVAVFGAGGVGGYAIEALARAGVGAIEVFDNDTVCPSNMNRQILATLNTIGKYKADAAAERIRAINPDCEAIGHKIFFLPENADEVDFRAFDYVVDAIDTVSGKLAIIEKCRKAGVPVISCMGTGNKLDPTAFKVADIFSTSVCPLAKVMRRELKKRAISSLKVVYSEEEPKNALPPDPENDGKRKVPPGSVSFVPPVAGMILAGEVIKDLIIAN